MNFSYLEYSLLGLVLILLVLLLRQRQEIKVKLRSIAETVAAFHRGDLNRRVEITREDDLGELAFYFNKMADEMAKSLLERSLEKEGKEKLLLQLPQGVFVLDAEGRVILMNDAASSLLSIQGTEYTNKALVSLVRNARLLEGVKNRKEGEEIPLDSGKTLLLHSVLLNTPSQETVYFLQDITRYKTLEKMGQDFVSNVSHELRTPLAALRSLLEAMEKGAIEEEELREDFLKSALKEVQRLDRLVKELLDLAKIEESRGQIDKSEVQLAKLVEEVRQNLLPLAEQKGIAVENLVPQKIPLFANSDQLKQVFINLIENGIKYSSRGGKVTINARQVLHDKREKTLLLHGLPGVEITVADTGIGIPKEHLPRIFERFYRVDVARSRALGGTGLGLSIVKTIIEGHGGSISISSEEGKGTVVTLMLP